MITGTSASIPRALRWNSASFVNSDVITSATGIPRVSSPTASCTLHDVQEPQSPMAVRTTSFSAAILVMSSGVALREKLSFR